MWIYYLVESTIKKMKPGSVILDMAVETGGNVEGAIVDEVVDINGIKVGVFGIITDIPSMVKELELKDPILTAQSKINELRPKVDLLVMLLNASIPQVSNSISNFEGVDYVFTSRETSRTRPETGQEGSGPLHYCMGIQGKYI